MTFQKIADKERCSVRAVEYSVHNAIQSLRKFFKNLKKTFRFWHISEETSEREIISAKQRAKWPCLHVHLATAARVKYLALWSELAKNKLSYDTHLAVGYLTSPHVFLFLHGNKMNFDNSINHSSGTFLLLS